MPSKELNHKLAIQKIAQSLYEKDELKLKLFELGFRLNNTRKPNVRQHFLRLMKTNEDVDNIGNIGKLKFLHVNIPVHIYDSILHYFFDNDVNVIFPKNTLFSKCSEIKSLFEDTHGGGRVIVYNPYAKIVELMFYIPDVEFYDHVLSNLSLPGKFEVCKCAYTEKDEAQLSFIVAQLNGWISGLYEYMNSSFMSNQIAKHERKYQDRTKQIIKQLGGAKKSMHYRMESMSFLCAKFPNSIDGLVDGVAKASQCIAKVISDLKNKFQANLGEKTARQFFYAWNLGFEFVHGYENKLVQLSWDIYFLDDINQENSTLKSKNKEIDGLSLAGESANLSFFMQTLVGPSIQRWTDDFKKLGLPFSYVKNRIPAQNMDNLPSLEQLLPLLVGDSIHTVRTVNPVVNKLKFFSCGRL